MSKGDTQGVNCPITPCLSTSVHCGRRLVLVRSITANQSAIQHCIVSSTPALHGWVDLHCAPYGGGWVVHMDLYGPNGWSPFLFFELTPSKNRPIFIVIDIHIPEDICNHTVITFSISYVNSVSVLPCKTWSCVFWKFEHCTVHCENTHEFYVSHDTIRHYSDEVENVNTALWQINSRH